MRRREFLTKALLGLTVPPGVLDSAARLEPISVGGTVGRQVAELEEAVHLRALEFPTTPTVDQLPRLLRDYAGFRRLVGETQGRQRFRVERALAQLCGLVGANAADWQDQDGARAWFGRGLVHAERGRAREAEAWIAARVTLLAFFRGDTRQAVHDAAYAAALSPRGQLGATLGNAVAAASLARMGHRAAAYMALDEARRAGDAQRDQEVYTAYSVPWYKLSRFASEVHTHLGAFELARTHQEQSLAGYPPRATTDMTFLRLERAEGMARQGYPREAARHAADALLALSPEKSVPILANRAATVADAIGTRGGSDAENLREVVRRMRGGTA